MVQTARAVEDMLLDDSASALEDQDQERDSSSPDPEINALDTPADDQEPDPHNAFVPVSVALMYGSRKC